MARRLHPVAQRVSRVDLTAERTAETALRDTWLSFLFIGPTSFVCCRRPRAPKSIAMRRTTRAVPATTSGVSQGRYHGAFLDRRPCSCYPGDLQRLLGIRPAPQALSSGASVGGHRNLPAGGQQTLPTHGHLVTQGAGGGGHDSGASAALDRHLGVMPHADMAACSGTRGLVASRQEPSIGTPPPAAARASVTRRSYAGVRDDYVPVRPGLTPGTGVP